MNKNQKLAIILVIALLVVCNVIACLGGLIVGGTVAGVRARRSPWTTRRMERDDHLPPGKGTIDFKQFIHSLGKAGYDGTMTLEIFTDDPQDVIRSRDIISKLLSQ